MQWNRSAVLGLIVAFVSLSSVAWSDPITIAPMTDDLNTTYSIVNVPGVGKFEFYSLELVPTTNIDHTIKLLAGGTLNAVGDSLTLPIELTSLNLSRSPYPDYSDTRILTTNGSQPLGSITVDYTRANEGGTFTATLPVDLVYTPTHTTFTDTLQIQGNWSIVGVGQYPGYDVGPTGFYLGDRDGKRQLFNEVGTDVNDVAVLAGPEPGTIGLFGVSVLVGLVAFRKTRKSTRNPV